jgi:hypothetical protein
MMRAQPAAPKAIKDIKIMDLICILQSLMALLSAAITPEKEVIPAPCVSRKERGRKPDLSANAFFFISKYTG